MNNERFIELLNLYIDRELSGPEIQEIEEAIAASPERQQTYAQYCRMQRACEHLLATDVQAAPKPKLAAILAAARREEEAEVVDFPAAAAIEDRPISTPARRPARSGWGWGALSGMAAAAVAFTVYTGTVQTAANDGLTPAGNSAPVAAAPAVAATAPIGPDDTAGPAFAAASEDAAYRTVFVLDADDNGSSTGLRLADTAARSEDPFAWMAQVQFEPIRPVSVDTLEFRTAAPMEVRNLPAFSTPYPGLDDTPPLSESAAFQFQR